MGYSFLVLISKPPFPTTQHLKKICLLWYHAHQVACALSCILYRWLKGKFWALFPSDAPQGMSKKAFTLLYRGRAHTNSTMFGLARMKLNPVLLAQNHVPAYFLMWVGFTQARSILETTMAWMVSILHYSVEFSPIIIWLLASNVHLHDTHTRGGITMAIMLFFGHVHTLKVILFCVSQWLIKKQVSHYPRIVH